MGDIKEMHIYTASLPKLSYVFHYNIMLQYIYIYCLNANEEDETRGYSSNFNVALGILKRISVEKFKPKLFGPGIYCAALPDE